LRFELLRPAPKLRRVKHSGKALRAAGRLIFWTLVLLLALVAGGVVATFVGSLIAAVSTGLIALWILFAVFTLYFFRDPDPLVPSIPNAIVSPAHGKVDVIDEADELEFMDGRCQRLSIFLSVFDVHVQKAPVTGRITHFKHQPGKFASAVRADNAEHNENVLIGFEPAEYPGEKIAVRLLAGVLARRIVPWIAAGDAVTRSERISLIQYGSRCHLYLPRGVKVHVKLGDKVKGGETIVASFP
jgi:phosphatidylserine decarboxylase